MKCNRINIAKHIQSIKKKIILFLLKISLRLLFNTKDDNIVT